MIKTFDLTKLYGKFVAVDSINLNIPPGEIYGFLGPNGAGKTTTIMMLLGIARPTGGEIRLFNEKFTPQRLDLRRRIGIVPEKHPSGMWTWMTALDYLRMFADLYEIDDTEKRISGLLDQVDLLAVRKKRISGYSRGMMQKLSIVRALLHDPDILFLDEPISGLDPIGIKQIRDLILIENREGRTIFISSHMLSEMEKVCERVAVIFQGKLCAEDKMENLLSQLTKDREIHVDLERVPPDLVGKLTEQPFILGVDVEENTLSIRVPKQGDFRAKISKFLINQSLVPLRIGEKAFSLEEAFITITKENIGMFADVKGRP